MAATIASREYRGDTRNDAMPAGGRVSENCTRCDSSPKSRFHIRRDNPLARKFPIFLQSQVYYAHTEI